MHQKPNSKIIPFFANDNSIHSYLPYSIDNIIILVLWDLERRRKHTFFLGSCEIWGSPVGGAGECSIGESVRCKDGMMRDLTKGVPWSVVLFRRLAFRIVAIQGQLCHFWMFCCFVGLAILCIMQCDSHRDFFCRSTLFRAYGTYPTNTMNE